MKCVDCCYFGKRIKQVGKGKGYYYKCNKIRFGEIPEGTERKEMKCMLFSERITRKGGG